MAFFRCSSGGGGTGSPTDTGSFSGSSTTYKLTLGFKPKQIFIYRYVLSSPVWSMSYDENYSTTKYYKCVSSNSSIQNIGVGSSNFHISSIDDDGVTFSFKDSTYAGYNWLYYAIG